MAPPPAFDGTARPDQPDNNTLIRGCIAECLAMTLFVYFGCGAVRLDEASPLRRCTSCRSLNPPARTQATQWAVNPLAVALQFGLGITVLAYMTAHSSGGHINFAVSLAASPPAQR